MTFESTGWLNVVHDLSFSAYRSPPCPGGPSHSFSDTQSGVNLPSRSPGGRRFGKPLPHTPLFSSWLRKASHLQLPWQLQEPTPFYCFSFPSDGAITWFQQEKQLWNQRLSGLSHRLSGLRVWVPGEKRYWMLVGRRMSWTGSRASICSHQAGQRSRFCLGIKNSPVPSRSSCFLSVEERALYRWCQI